MTDGDPDVTVTDTISNIRERLDRDAWKDKIPRADRELLIEFDEKIIRDRRLQERCGPDQHENLLNQCWAISKGTGQLAAACQHGEPGEEAFLEIKDWVSESGFTGSTVQGYMSALRVIAKDTDGNRPEHIEAISPSDYNQERSAKAPLPWKVIEYDEAVYISEVGALNSRDEALAIYSWDVGPRPMIDLNTLQRKNITFHDDHALIHRQEDPDGKMDGTGVLVSPAFPALKKWVLHDHPVHDDPDEEMEPETYIWTKLNENTKLKSAAQRISEIGDRVDIDKEITAQHMRRSSASVLARSADVDRRDLRKRYHWGIESPAPMHYVAMHTRSTQIAVARARGHDPSTIKREPDVAPVKCPHEDCEEWTTRGRDTCIWCGRELPEDATEVSLVRRPGTSEGDGLRTMVADREIMSDELRVIEEYIDPIRATPNVKEEISAWIRMIEYEEQRDRDDGVRAIVPGLEVVAVARATARQTAARAYREARAMWHSEQYRLPKTRAGWTIWTGILGLAMLSPIATIAHLGLFGVGSAGISIGSQELLLITTMVAYGLYEFPSADPV